MSFPPVQHLGIVVESGDMQKQARGFAVLARLYLETGQITKAHEFYVNVSNLIPGMGQYWSNSLVCVYCACLYEVACCTFLHIVP